MLVAKNPHRSTSFPSFSNLNLMALPWTSSSTRLLNGRPNLRCAAGVPRAELWSQLALSAANVLRSRAYSRWPIGSATKFAIAFASLFRKSLNIST
ncbi:hypothetical protein D9M72_525740 [compost metagenome]